MRLLKGLTMGLIVAIALATSLGCLAIGLVFAAKPAAVVGAVLLALSGALTIYFGRNGTFAFVTAFAADDEMLENDTDVAYRSQVGTHPVPLVAGSLMLVGAVIATLFILFP